MAVSTAPYSNLSVKGKQAVLALSVLLEQADALPKADRADLLELLTAYFHAADDEERQDLLRAMEELLVQAPITWHELPLVEKSTPDGLRKWTAHVAAKVNELRKASKLTQIELAEKSGLNQSHISRIENAEMSPSHHTLQKLADALGVKVSDFDPCLVDE